MEKSSTIERRPFTALATPARAVQNHPMRFSLIAFCTLIAFSNAAFAQEVKVLGTFGKWVAQTYRENGQPVCFISVKPDSSEGNYKARGDVLFMVTHRPSEQAFNVLSVVAGYQFQPDSDAGVTVTGKRFNLFTNGERAYARDAATDKTLVDLMIKGRNVSVRGTSNRGTVITDLFPLAGFTAAHKSITDSCKAS